MMISPELYYDENIKGKGPKEIMTQIRSLKKDINKIKKEIVAYCVEPKTTVLPDPFTTMKVYRQYLERAKQALEEAGEKYEPTILEKREIAFNESLENIKSIFFYIGGLIGTEYIDISFTDEAAICRHSFIRSPEEKIWEVSKEEIIDAFKDMHIGEWKRDYYNYNTLDGVQWCLDMEYFNGHRRIRISGSNAFPYNFEELMKFFEIEFWSSSDD